MIGDGPEQPDYTLHSDFMPAPEFAALRAELLERRPIMAQRHLDQGYNAVNVNFNLAGAPNSVFADQRTQSVAKVLAKVGVIIRDACSPSAGTLSLLITCMCNADITVMFAACA